MINRKKSTASIFNETIPYTEPTPSDFGMGLRFALGGLIFQYVAEKELEEGSRIRIEMDEVVITEDDYDLENFESFKKYSESMKIVIEI